MKKWVLIILSTVAVLALFVWLALPAIVSPILRSKLQDMVSDQLYAELTMDSLRYEFPYGVTAENARLIAQDPQGDTEILSVGRLNLALAELPLRPGPLVIERIIIEEPTVHVIKTGDGIIGRGMIKERDKPRTGRPPRKLSEIFRLRKLLLTDGKVQYTDRTRSDLAPMVYENLRADLNIAPQSGSLYQWDFSAGGGEMAALDADGTTDVDELIFELNRLGLEVSLNPNAAKTALPPQLQQLVETYHVQGVLNLTAQAHVPLLKLKDATATTTLELSSGSAKLPDGASVVDELALEVQVKHDERTNVSVESFTAQSSQARLVLDQATALIDPATMSWRLSQVSGKATVVSPTTRKGTDGVVEFAGSAAGVIPPEGKVVQLSTYSDPATRPLRDFSFSAVARGMSLQPPKFPRPLENISGTIDGDRDGLRISKFSASYGNDTFFISTATVPLDTLPTRLEVRDLLGEVRFAPPSYDYPEPLGTPIAQLNPSGLYFVTGLAGLEFGEPRPRPTWDLNITTSDGGVWLLDARVGVSELKANIHTVPELIELKTVQGKVFDGSVSLNGTIQPGKERTAYQGHVNLENVDLELAHQALMSDAEQRKIAGLVRAKLDFSGEMVKGAPLINGVTARGEAQITEGILWEAPVLSAITSRVRVARDALTAGQAAAMFSVQDQRVNLQQAAISSPALGIQGRGSIGFDGTLDMQVIAAPLGDWKDRLQSTGIPIVSRFAGEFVGGLQSVLNSATRQLLYEFQISGTAETPEIRPVPTPILTNTAARLFHTMLRSTERPAPEVTEQLMQTVREEADNGTPQTQPD